MLIMLSGSVGMCTLPGIGGGVELQRLKYGEEFPTLGGFLANTEFFSRLTTLSLRMYLEVIAWKYQHRCEHALTSVTGIPPSLLIWMRPSSSPCH